MKNTNFDIRKYVPSVLSSIVAIVLAVILACVLLYFRGVSPVTVVSGIISGSLGNEHAISETLVKVTPLLIIASGLTIAFRCGITNIGGEGQLYMGAIVAAVLGINLNLPTIVLIPLIIFVGFLAGAFWGSIAGILKAQRGISEVITSLMLNYVAILFTTFLFEGPMRDPLGFGMPQSNPINPLARLPLLMVGSRLHIGILLALALVPIVYVFLFKTATGYKVRATGLNAGAANYAGINTKRSILLVMIISGGLAGVAGSIEMTGISIRLQEGISPGYGFAGIVVALLGRLHPVGVLFSAILIGSIYTGIDSLQRSAGVPVAMVYVIQALIIMFVLAFEITRRKIK